MLEILLEFMGQLTSVRSFLLQSYFLKKLLIDCTDVLGNVQGFRDKFSRAPPWRDMGQWTEFPCLEMCRDPWIKTPVPLPGGIRANGWSFHVWKCAGVCGLQLERPYLEGCGHMDGVYMSR